MGPELLPVTRTLPTFTGKLAYNTAAALWHVMDRDDRDHSWGLRLGTLAVIPPLAASLRARTVSSFKL